MACSMLTRTRCFTPASTGRAAQPARTVRMVVRASSQKQQMPSIVKPAVIAAGRRSSLQTECTWLNDSTERGSCFISNHQSHAGDNWGQGQLFQQHHLSAADPVQQD